MSYHNHSKIIARRVRSGFGDIVQSALGDASNCGPDQVYDPNWTNPMFPGLKGQCVPKGSTLTAAGAGAGSSGGSWTDALTAGLNAAGNIFGQKPAGPVVVQQGGMSTATIAIMGIAALGLVLVLTRK